MQVGLLEENLQGGLGFLQAHRGICHPTLEEDT